MISLICFNFHFFISKIEPFSRCPLLSVFRGHCQHLHHLLSLPWYLGGCLFWGLREILHVNYPEQDPTHDGHMVVGVHLKTV